MTTFKALLTAFIAVSLFLSAGFAKGKNSDGSIQVDGYTKKNGTYVAPHNRTAPNKAKNDNWSTKGNVNPYTGKAGTKPREGESSVSKRTKNAPVVTQPAEPQLQSQFELKETVRRCNQLLDSYNNSAFGQRPFNAGKYEEIRLQREEAQGALNAGRYR